MLDILLAAAAALVAGTAGALVFRALSRSRIEAAKREAARSLEEARRSVAPLEAEMVAEARKDAEGIRAESEEEVRLAEERLQKASKRLEQREETVRLQSERVDAFEQSVNTLRRAFREGEDEERRARGELRAVRAAGKRVLAQRAGLSEEQAKDFYLARLQDELDKEGARRLYEFVERMNEEAEDEARRLLTITIQRCTFAHAVDGHSSVTRLQSGDERERLGKAIEALQLGIKSGVGIDVVVDEATPDVVVYSGGDGVQREIARRTVEKALREPASGADAAAVTRLADKVRRDLDRTMIGAARDVANTLGLKNIHGAIMEQLGRLLYRTSYGQNVLYHSREVAFIGGLLSSEIHLDFGMSRRSCLLHDVGKAVSVEVEGGHPEIGADLATKHGEHPLVVNAIAAHHEGVERHSLYPLLVQVADAISGARPGARRDSTEKYLLRLEQIMTIVNSKAGIEAAYPMQAGREIRVHVDPDKVEERDAPAIAKAIAREIEENVTYPGKIRITLVRESRASAVAK